mmetsp:Transcript_7036/g.10344  ORF Transcript_7036/g.10344 Transcript_7036/m.10344 type:complete len:360 (-) Transcript_7036:6-1085(-)
MEEQIQKLKQPRIIQYTSKSVNYSITKVTWIPKSARFASLGISSSNKGKFQIFSLKNNKIVTQHEANLPHPLTCCTFDHCKLDNRQVALGDNDGWLWVYDLENLNKPLFKTNAHPNQSLAAVAGCGRVHGAPELATAGFDGNVRVYDVRLPNQSVAFLDGSGDGRQAWSVAFGDAYDATHRCVAAGYDNGDLKVFDLRMNAMLWEHNLKNGIVSLSYDRAESRQNKLLATCLEGRFSVIDMKTRYTGDDDAYPEFPSVSQKTEGTVWDGAWLPQNDRLFVTCSAQGEASLWEYVYPSERSIGDPPHGVAGQIKLVHKHNFTSQPLRSWSWNRDKAGLACASGFDQRVYVAVCSNLDQLD